MRPAGASGWAALLPWIGAFAVLAGAALHHPRSRDALLKAAGVRPTLHDIADEDGGDFRGGDFRPRDDGEAMRYLRRLRRRVTAAFGMCLDHN